MRSAWTIVPLFLAAACGQPPERTAYLILDPEARDAGVSLEAAQWRWSAPFPVSADIEQTQPVLHVRKSQTAVALPAGQVGWVRGEDGTLDWFPVGGAGAASNRLILEGDAAAVQSAAKTLDAAIAGSGRRWTLTAPDLLARASFAAIAGIDAVEPVFPRLDEVALRLSEERLGLRAAGAGEIALARAECCVPLGTAAQTTQKSEQDQPIAHVAHALGGLSATLLVGRYQLGTSTLSLDASGRFELTCGRRYVGCVAGRGSWTVEGRRVVLGGRDPLEAGVDGTLHDAWSAWTVEASEE